MNFETIAKAGEKRIMAKYKDRFFILSLKDDGEEVREIESPTPIFRQGYWEPYEEKDETKKAHFVEIIEKEIAENGKEDSERNH